MDPAWFRAYVEHCHQRQSLPSVQEWVVAHEQLQPEAAARRAGKAAGGVRADAALVQHSTRNDARTIATGSGSGVNLSFPPGSSSIRNFNIFKELSLHDQAAATIASASQSKSGFSANMSMEEGEGLKRFQDYLEDFAAPHWLMTYSKEQEVHHEASNHSKFVDDLVSIVVQGVQEVGGDAAASRKLEESVRSLAKRLSSNSSQEEKLTLFSSFWMDRPNSSDPVVYGIFFTTVHARHQLNGKTEILTSTTTTYSVIYNLNSGVLIQYEALYNGLIKASVEDWLNSHYL